MRTTHSIWCHECDELTELVIEDRRPVTAMACEHCGALLRQRAVVQAQRANDQGCHSVPVGPVARVVYDRMAGFLGFDAIIGRPDLAARDNPWWTSSVQGASPLTLEAMEEAADRAAAMLRRDPNPPSYHVYVQADGTVLQTSPTRPASQMTTRPTMEEINELAREILGSKPWPKLIDPAES